MVQTNGKHTNGSDKRAVLIIAVIMVALVCLSVAAGRLRPAPPEVMPSATNATVEPVITDNDDDVAAHNDDDGVAQTVATSIVIDTKTPKTAFEYNKDELFVLSVFSASELRVTMHLQSDADICYCSCSVVPRLALWQKGQVTWVNGKAYLMNAKNVRWNGEPVTNTPPLPLIGDEEESAVGVLAWTDGEGVAHSEELVLLVGYCVTTVNDGLDTASVAPACDDGSFVVSAADMPTLIAIRRASGCVPVAVLNPRE